MPRNPGVLVEWTKTENEMMGNSDIVLTMVAEVNPMTDHWSVDLLQDHPQASVINVPYSDFNLCRVVDDYPGTTGPKGTEDIIPEGVEVVE